MCSLHDPPVPIQVSAALDASMGQCGTRCRAGSTHGGNAGCRRPMVPCAPRGPQLGRTPAWSAPLAAAHGRDGVQRSRTPHAIVAVDPAQDDAERRATPVDDQAALRARLAAVRWAGAHGICGPAADPPFAGTDALSSAARLQSNCPAPSRRSSNTRCNAAHTPACCQSRSLRQQVIPEPHPISAGRYSHGSPVLNTNRMPVSAARPGTSSLPPRGRGQSGGNRGAMNCPEIVGT